MASSGNAMTSSRDLTKSFCVHGQSAELQRKCDALVWHTTTTITADDKAVRDSMVRFHCVWRDLYTRMWFFRGKEGWSWWDTRVVGSDSGVLAQFVQHHALDAVGLRVWAADERLIKVDRVTPLVLVRLEEAMVQLVEDTYATVVQRQGLNGPELARKFLKQMDIRAAPTLHEVWPYELPSLELIQREALEALRGIAAAPQLSALISCVDNIKEQHREAGTATSRRLGAVAAESADVALAVKTQMASYQDVAMEALCAELSKGGAESDA